MMADRIVPLLAAVLALSLWAAPAGAQWMWKDEAGHTLASDQPPPAGTPESRILKQPKARTVAIAPTPAAPIAPKENAPKSLAERELDARQRQKEVADATRKADDDASKSKALQDNCAAVKGNLAALQAGGRAARFNERGEKVYLDDADRQSEIAKSQGQVAQYCR